MKYQKIKKMLLKRGIILAISATLIASTTNSTCFATEATQNTTENTTTQAKDPETTMTGETATETTVGEQAEYVKDENVYGKLANNGEVESLYVVNQFNVTKPGKIVDYGTYNRVENLTDLKEIATENDSQTVAVEEGNFYYQGEIEKGALPWNIDVTYKLDGQDIKAADLAGKSGNLEIHMKTSKNEAVNSTFYDNYLMQISMTLSNQNCSNIVAEGGTMADVGENKQITFTVMPQKEGDLTLTSNVTNFEMPGISIAAVPFSMSVEFPDTSEMSGGLTDLSDGISTLNDGTQDLNLGAGKIKDGMVSLLDGMVEFHTGLTTYTDGVVSLNDGIQKVDTNVGKLTSGAKKLADGSKSIAGGLDQMNEGGSAIVEGSKGIKGGIDNANSMLTAAGINTTDVQNDATMQALYQAVMSGYLTDAQYAAIATAVGTVGGLSNNYGSFETGLEQYVGGVSQLAGQYGEFNTGVSDFASGLSEFETGFGELADGSDKLAEGAPQLNDGSEQLVNGAAKFTSGLGEFRDGVQKLADGTDELADGTDDMPEEMKKQMDDMMDEYKYDFEPVSFVSDKNTNVEAVQFVLTTEEIKIQEPEAVKQEEKDKSFVERVQNLFSGLLDKKSGEE
jgi:X-X-X-Leu-X-X-Gly heptad repeat protein